MYLMHDTVDDLQALGRKLYEAVNTGDIPYANNGSYCHDRAYAMALKAERAGLPFEMAYFLPGSVDGMQVDGAVPWTAHVVIATPEMMIDGEPRRLFIDPSLFEGGPVGLQQVQDRLGTTVELETFPFGEFKPKQRPHPMPSPFSRRLMTVTCCSIEPASRASGGGMNTSKMG